MLNTIEVIGKRSPSEVVTVDNKFIVALYDNGKCTVFDRYNKDKFLFLNKSPNELIRSVFHNKQNSSIIVVSVTKRDEYNTLKCRSV